MQRRPARVNIRLLVTLAIGAVILCVGALVGHRVRKKVMAESALAAGQAAWQQNDFTEAAKQFHRYLSRYPDDLEVLSRYAEANLSIRPVKAEKVAAAISAYRRLMRQVPEDATAWKELARLYNAVGQPGEAAHVSRQRLLVAPSDLVAKLWLGRSLFAQHSFEEAKAVLEELSEATPRSSEELRACVQASGLLAGLLTQTSGADGDKPQGVLDRCVERFADSSEARLQRARYRRSILGDKDAAYEDLAAAERLFTDDPSVRLGTADEWTQWNEPDRAAPIVDGLGAVSAAVLDRFDIDPDAWVQTYAMTAGRVLMQQRRGAEGARLAAETLDRLVDDRRLSFLPIAIDLFLANQEVGRAAGLAEEFDQAVRERPNASDALRDQSAVLRAVVANTEGRYPAAIEVLDGQYGARRLPQKAAKLLWQALSATGQERRARTVLMEAVRGPQRDTELLLAAARMYRNHDWSRAAKLASEAAALAPGDVEAKVLVLEASAKAANTEGDRQLHASLRRRIVEAIAEHPRVGEFRVLLAALEFREGEEETALRTLETALTECEPNAEIALARVNVLDALDRKEEAVAECRTAIELQPAATALYQRLARLEEELGRVEGAREALRGGLGRVPPAERTALASALARAAESETEAMAALKETARQLPFDIRPRVALMALQSFRSDRAAAQATIDELKSIEGPGKGTHWRVEQARLWLDGGEQQQRRHEIEALLVEASRVDPAWPAPVVWLGKLHEALGRPDAAESVYRHFADTQTNNAAVVDALLRLLQRQRRFAEADQLLSRLPKGSARWHDHRLNLSLNKGEYSEALAELKKRADESTDDLGLRVLIARLEYQESKDPGRSLSEIDEVLRLAPNLREAIAVKSAILQAEGREDEALRLLTESVERYGDAAAYLARASCFAASRQWGEAEADLKRAKQLDPKGIDAYLALAELNQSRGQWAEAVAELEAAVNAEPASTRAVTSLVAALLRAPGAEHHERARKLAVQELAERPGQAELLMLAAEAHLRVGGEEATREAANLLDQAIAVDPRNTRAYVRRLELARNLEGIEKAAEILSRGLAVMPNEPDLVLSRAGLEREQGNLALARELARGVLDGERAKIGTDPAVGRRVVGAAALLADLSLRDGALEQAGRLTEEALRVDPESELARLTRARWLVAAGREQEAVSDLEAFRDADGGSRSVGVLLLLAELRRSRGELAAAESLLAQAASFAPKDPLLQIARMELAASRGQFGEAVACVEQENRGAPAPKEVVLAAASLLASSGEPWALQVAEEGFAAVLRRVPDFVDALYGLAHTRYLKGDSPGAIESYRRLLALEPFHAKSLNNLAWILAEEEEKLDEALALADKGVRRYPDDPYLLDTRGVIYARMNRLSEAERDLEQCLKLSQHTRSSRIQTLVHAGRVQLRLGNASAANRHFEEAKRLNEGAGVLSDEIKSEIERVLSGAQ